MALHINFPSEPLEEERDQIVRAKMVQDKDKGSEL